MRARVEVIQKLLDLVPYDDTASSQ